MSNFHHDKDGTFNSSVYGVAKGSGGNFISLNYVLWNKERKLASYSFQFHVMDRITDSDWTLSIHLRSLRLILGISWLDKLLLLAVSCSIDKYGHVSSAAQTPLVRPRPHLRWSHTKGSPILSVGLGEESHWVSTTRSLPKRSKARHEGSRHRIWVKGGSASGSCRNDYPGQTSQDRRSEADGRRSRDTSV